MKQHLHLNTVWKIIYLNTTQTQHNKIVTILKFILLVLQVVGQQSRSYLK